MEMSLKDVPKTMKLEGQAKYSIWNYKVKLMLMQEDLWHLVDPAQTGPMNLSISRGAGDITDGVISPPTLPRSSSGSSAANRQCVRTTRIITSTLRDSLYLKIQHFTNPAAIWGKLRSLFDIQNNARRLSIKEKIFSIRLLEGKPVDDLLTKINVLVDQLAAMGVEVADQDLVDLALNALPKSWSVFK
jgi:hypothetical protein